MKRYLWSAILGWSQQFQCSTLWRRLDSHRIDETQTKLSELNRLIRIHRIPILLRIDPIQLCTIFQMYMQSVTLVANNL